MKDYLASIAVFLLVIVLLGNVAMKQMRSANNERLALDDARHRLKTATDSSHIKSLQLMGQLGSENVDAFMSANGASLQSMTEINSINQRISTESERLLIPIQEQRTAERQLAGRNGTQLTEVLAHQYSIAINGSFRDCLVWLGQVEDAFPFSRIEAVELAPSGDFIVLKSTILFPRLNLADFASK